MPGTTEYPIPGGKTSFSYPDFAPTAIDYPDWVPPTSELGAFTPSPATAGDWQAPSWDVGAPPELDQFQYDEFKGPTEETFQTDPGYAFRVKEMERGIQNAASARGLLSTGGTLQDLMTARGSLASQEYGNIWNRNLGAYTTNRDTKLAEHDRNQEAKLKSYELKFGAESDEYRRARADYDTKRAKDIDTFARESTTYGTNYLRDQDTMKNSLTGWVTGYGRKADDWNRERDIYATNLGKEASSYGLNLDTGRFNLARDDSRWNNLLSLYGLATRNMPTYTPPALPAY